MNWITDYVVWNTPGHGGHYLKSNNTKNEATEIREHFNFIMEMIPM